jgi:nitrilase
VLASSNQTGITGALRFLGQAKIVDPGGNIVAKTWSKGGLAVADIDVAREIERARAVLSHLRERQIGSYHASLKV